MRNEGIGSWPARRARKTPHAVALVHEGGETTYAALHERVLRLAHGLRAAGIGRGDRVAFLGPNHPAFLAALFATGLLGAVFVPLNIRLSEPELAHQVADSGAALVLRPDAAFDDLVASGGIGPLDEPVSLDDPCMIMYTSGTTGRPKGAVLSHGNVTWNAFNVLVDQDLRSDEVALVSAPLFHTAGLNMLTLPVLLKGGACVLVPAFDAAATLDLIARHRVTFMFGVPTMFQQVARSPGFAAADLSSIRVLTCGGAPVPPALIETYAARGLSFLQGYGMTEAAPGVLFLDAAHARSKAGSAGVPHFFTDVVVEPGTGEVLVSGPNVMRGYWGSQEEAVRDGWFRTGDAARVDSDGYVYIVDRIKDMFVSGGENVYPAEVERVLAAHPDVLDCAVIGVPDPTWGEVGRAVVVLRPGAATTPDALLGSLQGRLAKYKIPKSVVLAAELPRTPSGKLLRGPLRRLGSG